MQSQDCVAESRDCAPQLHGLEIVRYISIILRLRNLFYPDAHVQKPFHGYKRLLKNGDIV